MSKNKIYKWRVYNKILFEEFKNGEWYAWREGGAKYNWGPDRPSDTWEPSKVLLWPTCVEADKEYEELLV